jgi:benzoyl-CoA reductase/2-hydroxyglutaryl-CoA dehydratase subunit BcrC/BadD/HgdB
VGDTARADSQLHPNLCAYVRACYSSALEGDHADLGGIIGVDSCDAMRRLFDVWRLNLSPDFSHMLSLPHRSTSEDIGYFASQLRGLADSLGRHVGRTISDENLAGAIETMNETRSLLQRLNQIRQKSDAISGSRFYEILADAMLCPKAEFNSRLRELLERMDEPDESDGVKIVLSGGVLDDPWIVGAIEEAGGRVVADDLCSGSRYFDGLVSLTDEEPLQAIARRYLVKAPCARMSDTADRVERLLRAVADTGASGLVYYSVKFCDPHTLDWVAVHEALRARGIPALRCETDYSVGGRERMRIRIEAFLEMLR